MNSAKIALAFFKGKWKRVLLSALMVIDACIYCCQQFPFVIVCGGDASCDNFCDGSYAFSRSECCECPCPGRKAWPSCYGYTVSGARIRTDKIPDYPNPGYYFQLLSSPVIPDFTECSDGGVEVGSYTWGYFAPDGTLVQKSFDGTVVIGVNGASFDETDGGTQQPGGAVVNVDVMIGAIVGSGYILDVSFISGIKASFPACTGGTAVGTLDPKVYDPAFEDPNPGAGATPLTVRVFPKCSNCDGTPCSPGTNPPARCALPTVTADIKTGVDGDGDPVFESVSIPTTKQGLCSWSGTTTVGGQTVKVTISPASGSCDHSKDVGSFAPEDYGLLLWKITFETPLGTVSSVTTFGSACPPTSFDADGPDDENSEPSSPYVNDIALSYGTDCGNRS